MGPLPDSLLGFEASGAILRVGSDVAGSSPGDRVYVLGHGTHRTVVRTEGKSCQRIPPNISREEAATITTCSRHSLLCSDAHRASSRGTKYSYPFRGLVGSAQAALQLASHTSLEVFATVGSEDKRALIHREYNVPYDYIFDSRDLSFAKGVVRMTDGRGVDCILNPLPGEALRQSWHCIAPFVETGPKGYIEQHRIGYAAFPSRCQSHICEF